jgi:hypothetical protein
MKNWIPLIGLFFLSSLCGIFWEAGDNLLHIWGRDNGLGPKNLDTINFVRIFAIFRLLWAPIFTLLFVHRRSWVVLLAFMGAFTLLSFSFFPFLSPFFIISLIVFSFIKYSLFILTDASQMDAIPRSYWGFSESLCFNGYLVGISLTSATALLLSHHGFSWRSIYFYIVIIILIIAFFLIKSPIFRFLDKKSTAIPLKNFWHPIKMWLKQPYSAYILALMCIYCVQNGFIEPQRDYFLLQKGVSKKSLAGFCAVVLWVEVFSTFLAAFSIRYKGYLWTLTAGMIFNSLGIACIIAQILFSCHHHWLLSSFLFLQFTRGFAFTGFFAFQLITCHANYAISQLAFLETISQLGEKLASLRSGWIAQEMGWSSLFLLALAINCIILFFLKTISHMSFFSPSPSPSIEK